MLLEPHQLSPRKLREGAEPELNPDLRICNEGVPTGASTTALDAVNIHDGSAAAPSEGTAVGMSFLLLIPLTGSV